MSIPGDTGAIGGTGTVFEPRFTNTYEDAVHGVVPAFIIATAALLLRFWARLVVPENGTERKLWWDDWFILFAWPVTIGQSIAVLLWAKQDLGQHIWNVPLTRVQINLKYLLANYFLLNFGSLFARLSVLFFYQRVFTKINKPFRYALYIAFFLVVAQSLGNFFTALFQCKPIEGAWNILIPGRKCVAYFPFYASISATILLVDLIVLLLPIPLLFQLQLSVFRKFLVLLVFSSGGLVVMCAAVRQVFVMRLGEQFFLDPLYNISGLVGKLSAVETPLCMFAASMSVIFMLIVRIKKHGFRSAFSSKDYDSKASSATAISMEERNRRWTRRQSANNHPAEVLSKYNSDEEAALGQAGYSHSETDESNTQTLTDYRATIEHASPTGDVSTSEDRSLSSRAGERRPKNSIRIKREFEVSEVTNTSPRSAQTTSRDLDATYHKEWFETANRQSGSERKSGSDRDR